MAYIYKLKDEDYPYPINGTFHYKKAFENKDYKSDVFFEKGILLRDFVPHYDGTAGHDIEEHRFVTEVDGKVEYTVPGSVPSGVSLISAKKGERIVLSKDLGVMEVDDSVEDLELNSLIGVGAEGKAIKGDEDTGIAVLTHAKYYKGYAIRVMFLTKGGHGVQKPTVKTKKTRIKADFDKNFKLCDLNQRDVLLTITAKVKSKMTDDIDFVIKLGDDVVVPGDLIDFQKVGEFEFKVNLVLNSTKAVTLVHTKDIKQTKESEIDFIVKIGTI